ncbi:hypothetical protein OUZ56_028006 [Daphnia magna]|uniref:Uncharacterized protein n=1 Tax=Daphnia magna TaxID=35525 RepID=A0ABR0B2K2_9CRUS|nr:hypothetical protein OUZ56_028006 [Daphnia magna]
MFSPPSGAHPPGCIPHPFLSKEDRKFEQIKWGGFYQLRTLAFGFVRTWLFTKILKPVITCLRKKGSAS